MQSDLGNLGRGLLFMSIAVILIFCSFSKSIRKRYEKWVDERAKVEGLLFPYLKHPWYQQLDIAAFPILLFTFGAIAAIIGIFSVLEFLLPGTLDRLLRFLGIP